ncbi:hypothetical protein ABIE67_009455 [Streptomyces sp. V4I8]|uniref:ANTAR domain-containing protein n=1 Tax=Streptomyces sp. V4I8 TaxID=3156469 RepID=UPI0035122C68
MAVSADMERLLHELAVPGEMQPADALRQADPMLSLDGLALSLLHGDGLELLWHTGETAALLDDMQFIQGHGPSHDAMHSLDPVLETDLAHAPAGRWPGLAAAAGELAVHAVFAFPLTLGVIRLGVLTGHRRIPGPLTPQQTTDALALADALTELLAAPTTPAAPAVRHLHRADVHQATGMTAAQLGISPADALARIRAHAYRHNQPLLDTAHAILTGQLRLADNSRPATSS